MAQSISESTRKEFKTAFQSVDTNKDGLISIDQLFNLLNILRYNPTDQEKNNLIEDYQENNVVQLDFDQFLDFMAKEMFEETTEKDLLTAFKLFDKEGMGKIPLSDLKKCLLNLNKDLTEEDLHDLLKDLQDERGYINYGKLVKEYLFIK